MDRTSLDGEVGRSLDLVAGIADSLAENRIAAAARHSPAEEDIPAVADRSLVEIRIAAGCNRLGRRRKSRMDQT